MAMGTRDVSVLAQKCVILLLIFCVQMGTSWRSDEEATALSSCPNHESSTEANSCAPSGLARRRHGGDRHPVPDMMGPQELSTAALIEAVVLALLTARKEETTEVEIFFILIFPSALLALVFCEILLRNMYPRFAQIIERLLLILFFNGVMALSLPAKFLWVPALCFGGSLITLIFLHP